MPVVAVLFLASSAVEQQQDKRADALNLLPSLDVKASNITGYHLDNPGVLYIWMRLKNRLLEGIGNLLQSFKEIHKNPGRNLIPLVGSFISLKIPIFDPLFEWLCKQHEWMTASCSLSLTNFMWSLTTPSLRSSSRSPTQYFHPQYLSNSISVLDMSKDPQSVPSSLPKQPTCAVPVIFPSLICLIPKEDINIFVSTSYSFLPVRTRLFSIASIGLGWSVLPPTSAFHLSLSFLRQLTSIPSTCTALSPQKTGTLNIGLKPVVWGFFLY